jgi:uncharacterized protein (TIGR02271 family)
MTKTVTSLFHDYQKATAAMSQLEQAGITRGDVDLYSECSDDLIDNLEDMGVPRSDAHAYSEGVRRGGTLVAVECDDDEVDRVVRILDSDGVMDLGEQQTAWRSEGWQGYDASRSGGVRGLGSATAGVAGDLTGSPDITRARSDTSSTSGRDEVIPIAEEELHVGKREVGHGRVRIQSRVVERPVQEQVTLRDETVSVERRPASGTMQAGSVGNDPFQERTIEMEERDEEAVVSKAARVKEELVVHKDVDERNETVSDTVRRTEVDIEDERDARDTGTSGPTERRH